MPRKKHRCISQAATAKVADVFLLGAAGAVPVIPFSVPKEKLAKPFRGNTAGTSTAPALCATSGISNRSSVDQEA